MSKRVAKMITIVLFVKDRNIRKLTALKTLTYNTPEV